MRALVPVQQGMRSTAFLDRGRMGVDHAVNIGDVIRHGWSLPKGHSRRIWHSRRPMDHLLGLFCRSVLRQPWELVYTSPSPRRHGLFWRAIVNRSSAVIAVTDNAASYLDWHNAVVPHGVNVDTFSPPPDKIAAWQEGGLPGKYGIGTFGRIRPSKGTDLFVDAMCEVLPRFPEFTAILAGLCKPRYRQFQDELKAKVESAGLLDRIVFLGDLDFTNIKLWYQRISLCIAVPRSEGFGLTPLEAMSSGAAALTSSEGYFPMMISPSIHGDVLPTGDLPALQKALAKILKDPEALLHMGQQARSHVVAHHSIEHEAESIHAVYDEVLARAAG